MGATFFKAYVPPGHNQIGVALRVMTKRWLIGILVAVPALAHADARSTAASELGEFANRLKPGDPFAGFMLTEARWKPAECTKALAKAKKAGVKPDDGLVGMFEYHPKAKKTSEQYKFEIAFADADWICSEYTSKFALESAAVPIRAAADFVGGKKANLTPTAEDARGFNPGAGKSTADQGRACMAAIDQAIKDGVAPTTKLKTAMGDKSLTDAKPICQALIDYGTKFEEFIAAEYKAKQAERAKKYEAAGIKGAKLALMVEYDNVYWRGRGCEKIEDVAVLAKATVLYQWLENSDGTHTIRTYRFAGNAVKGKADKTYRTEAAAYKGCP
jgi:hypothetical protein